MNDKMKVLKLQELGQVNGGKGPKGGIHTDSWSTYSGSCGGVRSTEWSTISGSCPKSPVKKIQ